MASATSTESTNPTSSSSSSVLERKGCLEGTVLSVYDLPFPEQPIAVSLSACGMVINSGPPLARHKDRNSFRFASTTASADNRKNISNENINKDVIKLVAPLSELHQSDLVIKVVYNNERNNMKAELPLRQLRVHENKWLILNLSGVTISSHDGNDDATSSTMSLTRTRGTNMNDSTKLEEDLSPTPTIRIKLKLSGPYRPEIAAILNMAQLWFDVVDKAEYGARSTLRKVPKVPNKYRNWLLLPAVPAVAVIIVASPVVAGLVAFVVPFLLPLALLLVGILATALISVGILYASTVQGRGKLNLALGPLIETFVFSRSGQAFVYDTGPRPTPVSICRQVLPNGFWSKLWTSLLIDLIGSSSYLLPVVGEGFDLAWAPVQTVLIMAMYDSTSPNLKYVSFFEEIMPFTDIIPSATIGWGYEFVPILWNDHSRKNNVAPEVTQAVTQLVTTAANAAISRNRTSTATK